MAKMTKAHKQIIELEVAKRVDKKMSSYAKIIEKSVFFKQEFKKHIATAVLAAFAFLIALVWRDLIAKVVTENTKIALLETYPYIAELYTAVIVTIVAVAGIVFITWWVKPK